MNLLKKLFGLGPNQPEGSQWNSKPPEQRPAPKRRVQAAQAAAPAQATTPVSGKEKNPFLDDDFGDMELVNEVPDDVDDPYTSATWKVEQENNERTLKATRMVPKHKKNKAVDFNPYDTGVFKEKDWRD